MVCSDKCKLSVTIDGEFFDQKPLGSGTVGPQVAGSGSFPDHTVMSPPATSGTGWALFRGFDPVDLVYADYFQVTSIEVVGANGQCVAHNLPGQTGGSCRVEGPCRIGSIKLFCKANDLGRKLAVNGSTGLVVTHVNPFDATQGWYEIFINLQANCGTLSTFEISIGAHDGHAMAGAVATIIVYVECTRCDGNDGSDEDCC